MTTELCGAVLLRDPHFNKSTTLPAEEREALGLVGLLPEGIDTEDIQIQRVMQQLALQPTDLEKYTTPPDFCRSSIHPWGGVPAIWAIFSAQKNQSSPPRLWVSAPSARRSINGSLKQWHA